jgi:hypothetical protein
MKTILWQSRIVKMYCIDTICRFVTIPDIIHRPVF